MMPKNILTVFCFVFLSFANSLAFGQERTWKDVQKNADASWLTTVEADMLVDVLVRAQLSHGGWMKNHDWMNPVDWTEVEKARQTGYGETIDNGATTSELTLLAKYLDANRDDGEKIKKADNAFQKGIRYLLDAQYDNGGWPQFFPLRVDKPEAYDRHVTFNDNAMVNVLVLFQKIIDHEPPFVSMGLDEVSMTRIRLCFAKGVQCLLDCQIRKNGKRTVWCQQHDERTLLPTKARAYELPSFCGAGETVGILMFLMKCPVQTNEVREAVAAGIEWLQTHQIKGKRVEQFVNEYGQTDLRVVDDPEAPAIWARFYDLDTEKPFFCDRDGLPKEHLSEIGYERRVGYNLLNVSPQKAIDYYCEHYR